MRNVLPQGNRWHMRTVLQYESLQHMGAYQGMDSTGSGYGTMVDYFERDNETLGSIKGGEFLDQFSNY